ncbi:MULTISPECIES: hypothetical protein [unclassified Streptomyces]|uniref:hypothetical protein n=1 Tax=unclassified Streptomyces TaxID=2593676 RepID=UPI000F5B93D6|nr:MULTISPECIES: hypothetical protein [unclassified Streptomyces]WSG51804.1 hypothetical protein OHA38_19490 [Streptomyces sp. NBC_01732]WSX02460.1 hypothetical protein OG355_19625 [Streptomyces sp. NBC_00987]MCX4395627.1 hypothetical protein [Streptomyces sp. NBC_01767]RPK68656.1 hypothetical protein EES42_20250 [Streptomyces sp. ADI95-17]WSC29219.1 hypothetical protein OG902_22400 [Streptomyces sp. NBC_01768]
MTVHHATAPTATERLRAAWNSAHAPVPGVPRWARVAAYVIPFTVLPSGLWRITTVVFHVGDDGAHGAGQLPSWLPGPVYIVALSIVSELLAFTAIGLIAAWGEVLPHWIPLLGGRRVLPLAAVLPAALGATILTVLWTTAFATSLSGLTIQGRQLPDDYPSESMHGWQLAFFDLTYAPLLLWGPLLAAVCFAYWRRRCTRTIHTRVPKAAS